MSNNSIAKLSEANSSARELSRLKVLNTFAIELIGITDEIDLAWYVAREVVGRLGFDDCVVYYIDPDRNMLRQMAAIGAKNPKDHEITNLLEIPVGKGVTGHVADTRRSIIVDDLSRDDNYIPDLEEALSEICVPLLSSGQIFGVIDCEDPRPGHFNQDHLEILSSVAAMTSAKLEFLKKSQELRESEYRNRLIMDANLDGIISTDSLGMIIECNPAAEKIFGFTRAQVKGKPLADTIIPPHKREQHNHGFQRFVGSGESVMLDRRIETTGMRTNGEEFPLELTITPHLIKGQQYFTGFLRDMSEQKKAETTRKDLERRFSTFIEHLPSAILIKNIDGSYLNANSRWHQWFNPDGVDIFGKTAFDFLSDDYAMVFVKENNYILEHRKPLEEEKQLRIADGSTITALIQNFPILNENGDIFALGSVSTDISVRKQMEEDLRNALIKAEESNHSKSVFLATMSHELRTPLNAIIGFSDMISGQFFGPVGNEKYIEYAQNIHVSGKHLSDLINEVLDISAIELGIRDLALKSISLNNAVEDCVKSVKLNAQNRGIELFLNLSDTLPEISADERAVKQIFLNLLGNAVKYSRPGDEVIVTTSMDRENAIISVADNGVGIDADYLPTLTEPFVRGHDNSLVAHEGVGLGLSIVKSLVDAHNGSLKIESEIGKGTTVKVSFPLVQAELN